MPTPYDDSDEATPGGPGATEPEMTSGALPRLPDANAWIYDPNATPAFDAAAGHEWFWNGTQWAQRQVQQTPPPPPPNPNTNEGDRSNEGYDFSRPTPWEFPEFSAPKFSGIGNFTPPPAFQYDAFRAPSLEDARNEPGYEFARGEGQRALETSAAARGIARTGGTLKDLISWGNKFGEQNYGNVFNRGAQTYGMNRENALGNYLTNYNVSRDTFNTNYGQARDIYDRDYQGAIAEFNPKFEGSRMRFEDMYRRWRDGLDANTRIVEAGARTD